MIFSKKVGTSGKGTNTHLSAIMLELVTKVKLNIIPFEGGAESMASLAGNHRVVSQLLTELDGIEPRSRVIVLAATNRIDMLDPSILRSGRFGTHIFVPLPDKDERAEILRLHIGNAVLADGRSPEELARELALKTEDFSGAELKYLCDEAKMQALRNSAFAMVTEITTACFEKSLERMMIGRNRLDEYVNG